MLGRKAGPLGFPVVLTLSEWSLLPVRQILNRLLHLRRVGRLRTDNEGRSKFRVSIVGVKWPEMTVLASFLA